jgi:hypothetical protein
MDPELGDIRRPERPPTPTQPEQFQRTPDSLPEQRPNLVRSGLLEELLDVLLGDGPLAQSSFNALHPEREEHDQ